MTNQIISKIRDELRDHCSSIFLGPGVKEKFVSSLLEQLHEHIYNDDKYKEMMEITRKLMRDTEQYISRMEALTKLTKFTWLILRIVIIAIVVCLFVNLAIGLALLTTKKTLYVSLPILFLLVLFIIYSLTIKAYDKKSKPNLIDSVKSSFDEIISVKLA